VSKPTLGAFVGARVATLDLPRLLETRMLIQANSGNGKSRALRRLLEQTAGKVQQLIIDPEGEFATLREKHDVVVCSAAGGDALAHPRTAGLLARRLLEVEASAVLDISELKAHERHSFVRLFLAALVEAPKSLRHSALVVLDEAQIFAPEKGQGESEAGAAVIDIATRGRKRGLCLVAATQRISMLHKAVAAECKNRLIGGTSLDVDVKRAAFDLGMPPKEALALLRALAPGHFYAFGPALGQLEPRELVTGDVFTTHPEVGHRQAIAPPKPTAAIVALLPKLADLPKEAETEARTVAELKRELAAARRELTAAKSGGGRLNDLTRELQAADKRGADRERKTIVDALHRWQKSMKVQIHAALDVALREVKLPPELGKSLSGVPHMPGISRATERHMTGTGDGHATTFRPPVPPSDVPRLARSDGALLPKGERAVLAACIQFPDGLERDEITVLTGYKRSTRDEYARRLTERGFLTVEGSRLAATEAGRAAMPDAEPLPTGEELQRHWFERLPDGEGKILRVLVDRHPEPVARDQLTEETGFKRSTRDEYLRRLRLKRLVADAAAGEVVASATLF
jgi:uncharacterized protein DUF87